MRAAAFVWLVAWAFVGLPWRSFTLRPSFDHVRLMPYQFGRPSSHLLNVLAFVPLGICGDRIGWGPARVAQVAAGISMTTEALQLFSTRRYPSVSDVLSNTLGAILGVGMSRVARGRRSLER
jgi:glycopeptide antibiotics resistance protein